MNKIITNLINCLMAGVLVLLGACTDGVPTWKGLFIAFIAASIVAVTQFKDFWKKEELTKRQRRNCNAIKLFNFLNI